MYVCMCIYIYIYRYASISLSLYIYIYIGDYQAKLHDRLRLLGTTAAAIVALLLFSLRRNAIQLAFAFTPSMRAASSE